MTCLKFLTVLREYVQCRQTLKKPSSAKQPLRRPALMKLRKEEKAKDPLVGCSLLSRCVGNFNDLTKGKQLGFSYFEFKIRQLNWTFLSKNKNSCTGLAQLIRSHSSARILWNKWKYELTVHFRHEMIGKHFRETSN